MIIAIAKAAWILAAYVAGVFLVARVVGFNELDEE